MTGAPWLWCLHHIGPDEVHPAPDFATAQKWADWANERFADHWDVSRFVVAIWPWTADRHAETLAKSIEDWTVPTPQPTEDAIHRALEIFESIGIIASGCASTHGDPGGGLEMINGYASDGFEILARASPTPLPSGSIER